MAKLKVQGLDTFTAQLDRIGQRLGPVGEQMLHAGAEQMKRAWVSAIDRHGHVDNGDMRKSVRPTKIKTTSGTPSIEVYPQGKDRKGVRNAEKAFVLHYGFKSNGGSHFVDEAVDKGEGPATEAMAAVFDDFLKSEGVT